MAVLKAFNKRTRKWEPVSGPATELSDAPGAHVYRSTVQSIAHMTNTLITFDTVLRDSHGFWNAGQPTRLTVPTGQAGWYLVIGGGGFDGMAATRWFAAPWKNGAEMTGSRVGVSAASSNLSNASGNGLAPVWMNAGEYVELNAWHNQGSNANYGGAGGGTTASLALIRLASGTPGPRGLPGDVPTGTINQYAGATAPTGWLLCDGAAVSRSTYANLWAVIGTTFGSGDGSTTFNVPNLKGKVIVGIDAGDTAFDERGETGGAKTHTHAGHSNHDALTNNHSGTAVGNHADHTHSIPIVGAMTAGGSNVTTANTNGVSTSGAYTHSVTQPSAHGAISAHSAHDTPSHLSPYMALHHIIKT